MDRSSLENIIIHHAGKLEKLSESIPGHFDEKDVHHWRVEYKKLRAFLRMITAAVADHMPLMTGDFRKIYGAAGSIRDLQLFLNILQQNLGEDIEHLPVFQALLVRKLFTAKEEFIRRCDCFSFEREKARWLIMPPDYLDTDIVKRFVQQRVTAIRLIMLAPDSDEGLHSLRKHLKDILYAKKVYSDTWGIPFPVTGWKHDKKLDDLAEALGKYNDLGNFLGFLENEYTGQLPAEEKNGLLPLHDRWWKEKDEGRGELLVLVDAVRFLAEVKET